MTRTRAHLIVAFLAVCASWNYIPAQLCLTVASPQAMVALRFGVGALVTMLIFPRATRALTWRTFWPGLVVGMFFGGALFPLYRSLETTHSGVTAFLVGTCAVFVPLLEYLFLQRLPTRAQLLGLAIALVGSAAMSLKGDFSVDAGSLWGLLSALIFAFWSVSLSHYRKFVSGVELGLGQIYGTAVLFLLITLGTSRLPFSSFTPTMWLGLLYLGAIGVAARFVMQSHVQGFTTATSVEIIFLLEPLFAFLWATIFNSEVATSAQLGGCVLVLLGVAVAQIPPARRSQIQIFVREEGASASPDRDPA